MTILHLDTSILAGGSVTRELSALIVARLARDGQVVIRRDLVADPLPHLTPAVLPSAHPASAMAEPLSEAAREGRAKSDDVLEEFLGADTIVIGVPMYNFGIPSQLKAWLDRILVPGRTFRYGADGPEGLAGGKRVIVALARGGFYGPQTAAASAEHAESYLRALLAFIGVREPEFVLAEGLKAGEQSRADALAAARDAIEQLAA